MAKLLAMVDRGAAVYIQEQWVFRQLDKRWVLGGHLPHAASRAFFYSHPGGIRDVDAFYRANWSPHRRLHFHQGIEVDITGTAGRGFWHRCTG